VGKDETADMLDPKPAKPMPKLEGILGLDMRSRIEAAVGAWDKRFRPRVNAVTELALTNSKGKAVHVRVDVVDGLVDVLWDRITNMPAAVVELMLRRRKVACEKRGHDTQFTAAQDFEASQLLSVRPSRTGPRLTANG
jgi:hypothetical protein